MATESGFDENPRSPTKDHKAIGLMQIMPETVSYLGTRSKDIKNHFVEMSLEDAKDPSVAIAAATRWLFRKYRLVKGKKKGATWMDALEEYKGITNQKGITPENIRLKLNEFYKKLQE
jgi:soluble lytic murein transglycosylase-like protein